MRVELFDPADQPRSCPWSRGKLRKVGESLMDPDLTHTNVPPFEEVALWYGELMTFAQAVLYVQDWDQVIGSESDPVITGRVKTDDTLREKLHRNRNFPLQTIHDVAGVRFENNMTLKEQDAVVERAVAVFARFGWTADVKDLRDPAGLGNYRAVHIRLQRDQDKARIEIQVRTEAQGMWANIYERVADAFGREIRYGWLPEDDESRQLIVQWQEISVESIAHVEKMESRMQGLLDTKFGAKPLKAPHGEKAVEVWEQVGEIKRGLLGRLEQVQASIERELREL